MSDERIVEYLRSRGRAEPPHDLTIAVADAAGATPQVGSFSAGAWLPAVATLGAAAAILAVSLLVEKPPEVGPDPNPSASEMPSSEPSPTESGGPITSPGPSPSATSTAIASDPDLLNPGNVMQFEIRSAEGVRGRITLERGEDVGGYPFVLDPSSTTHFFVELFAKYDLDNGPETAAWGSLDWRVTSTGTELEVEVLSSYPYPQDRRPLGTWPGATVPEDAYAGWLIFAVPREYADDGLELAYRPPGVFEAARIPLRVPGAAPDPVTPLAWPRPDPVYVTQDGLPFTVLESAEADALFVETDTCTNPEDGYTVNYPDSWYTNTAVGSVPACSWFSPVFYELNADGSRPEEIAIHVGVMQGAIGFIWAQLYSETVMLDGFEAVRYEEAATKDPTMPTNQLLYAYLSRLDTEIDGRKLWSFTGTDYGGEYELNRAVFDRIMASLRWTDGGR